MKTKIKDIVLETPCEISGWIETIREHKTMLFLLLRDRSGQIQVTIDKNKMPELSSQIAKPLKDSVLRVQGIAVKAAKFSRSNTTKTSKSYRYRASLISRTRRSSGAVLLKWALSANSSRA